MVARWAVEVKVRPGPDPWAPPPRHLRHRPGHRKDGRGDGRQLHGADRVHLAATDQTRGAAAIRDRADESPPLGSRLIPDFGEPAVRASPRLAPGVR
jgi:hypothetical protein